MRMSQRCGLLACMLLIGSAASAHHSSAMWDDQRTVELSGTVTRFEWTNPHAWIWLQAEQPDQNTWGIEAGALNNMERQGWSRLSLKTGDRVTITVHPNKRAANGTTQTASLIAVKLADGTPVPAASSQTPPP